MTYQPEPIDTSKVVIDTEHLKLTELLAKNTHEIWSEQRLADGWEYGEQRNDTLKQHPGLVPYEELSESEKEYDRRTALGVIKTLLALGYRIEGEGFIPEDFNPDQDQEFVTILNDLKNTGEINISSLLNIQRQTIKVKPHTPLLYQVLAESILQLGEPLIAYDILAEGLKHWQNDLKLRQLTALALARSGATQKANTLTLELVAQGYEDSETLSLLARTYKDLWHSNEDQVNKQKQLELSAQNYQKAYQKTGDIYPGINAATMTLLSGDETKARDIAQEVKTKCQAKLPSLEEISNNDYWNLATLGEACLILKQWQEVGKWYQQAAAVGKKQYGDFSSTQRNAKMIIDYYNGDRASQAAFSDRASHATFSDRKLLKEWFQIPRIAVFSGHMIDLPDRPESRFPPEMETEVYQAILNYLKNSGISFGYASAACGSDILFLEAILELEGEIHIVLPYPQEQFIVDCVDIIPDSNWKERFLNVLSKATEISVACDYAYEEKNSVYQYTNRLLHGLAKIRSQQLDTQLIPLAVWDGKQGDGFGGTATMVQTWRDWGYDVKIISTKQIKCSSVALNSNSFLTSTLSVDSRPIMALLFADVVKFSRLNESQIPSYVEHFLGAIANLQAEKKYEIALSNTWGDALYYVFPHIADAGNFALDICDLIDSIDWKAKGLPEDLNLRVSLHAGPVYSYINPITKKMGYSGSHVSYAARIEPITPPGKVYASKEFAAVASAENVQEFCCDYVGQTPLAKNYGTFPAYHVQRNN